MAELRWSDVIKVTTAGVLNAKLSTLAPHSSRLVYSLVWSIHILDLAQYDQADLRKKKPPLLNLDMYSLSVLYLVLTCVSGDPIIRGQR